MSTLCSILESYRQYCLSGVEDATGRDEEERDRMDDGEVGAGAQDDGAGQDEDGLVSSDEGEVGGSDGGVEAGDVGGWDEEEIDSAVMKGKLEVRMVGKNLKMLVDIQSS